MYSPAQRKEIINKLCKLIESGISLRKALESDSNMPSRVVFYEWLEADKEKANQYVRACETRADLIFEEIMDIADDSGNDVKYTEHGEVINSEFVQRSRLRVDSRKWMLGKMNPKKYGDKIDLTGEVSHVIFPGINLDVTENNSTE
jgi:hypothetical protein